MSEKPILFSSEMVRAILDGRKTQTRRVIKPQPEKYEYLGDFGYIWKAKCGAGIEWLARWCSHGQVGDTLWVRETWATSHYHNNIKPRDLDKDNYYGIVFKATEPLKDYKWRPSIFMPRWASRITLEITDVRIERVQDITPEDAHCEGIQILGGMAKSFNDIVENQIDYHKQRTLDLFTGLWDSINHRYGYGWAQNPWVWVIEFRRIK